MAVMKIYSDFFMMLFYTVCFKIKKKPSDIRCRPLWISKGVILPLVESIRRHTALCSRGFGASSWEPEERGVKSSSSCGYASSTTTFLWQCSSWRESSHFCPLIPNNHSLTPGWKHCWGAIHQAMPSFWVFGRPTSGMYFILEDVNGKEGSN